MSVYVWVFLLFNLCTTLQIVKSLVALHTVCSISKSHWVLTQPFSVTQFCQWQIWHICSYCPWHVLISPLSVCIQHSYCLLLELILHYRAMIRSFLHAHMPGCVLAWISAAFSFLPAYISYVIVHTFQVGKKWKVRYTWWSSFIIKLSVWPPHTPVQWQARASQPMGMLIVML